MGARGRKRTQKRKAANRTGLIKSLTGWERRSQKRKRLERERHIYCTSRNYCKPNDHCRECSYAIYYGVVMASGRVWTFEYRPMYGVYFLTGKNEPMKIQPRENHPVWSGFEKWRVAKFEAK